jgi:small subunit ribosomal protein S4
MPRRGPVEKRSRRVRVELSLKGARLLAGKSALQRRRSPPGPRSRRRPSDSVYRDQLREKQKVQWFYGIALLRQLEQRLDNVLHRLGFASTRAQARQFITHGHVLVGARRVNRPGYQVRPGETVAIRPGSGVEPLVKEAIGLGFRVPPWLASNPESLSGQVLRLPDRQDIDAPVDENRAVEFYSKL